jgi:hypothetical protein
MCLGPAVPATCKQCGEKVGVPYWSMWTVLPFVVAIFFASLAGSLVIKIVLWLVGFLIMLFCHLRFVPLIKR